MNIFMGKIVKEGTKSTYYKRKDWETILCLKPFKDPIHKEVSSRVGEDIYNTYKP